VRVHNSTRACAISSGPSLLPCSSVPLDPGRSWPPVEARPLNGSGHLAALSYLAGSYVISRACLTLSLSVRAEHYTQPPSNVYSSDHRFSTVRLTRDSRPPGHGGHPARPCPTGIPARAARRVTWGIGPAAAHLRRREQHRVDWVWVAHGTDNHAHARAAELARQQRADAHPQAVTEPTAPQAAQPTTTPSINSVLATFLAEQNQRLSAKTYSNYRRVSAPMTCRSCVTWPFVAVSRACHP
jgi:hypothetical protein